MIVNAYLGCSQSTGSDTACEIAKNYITRRIQGVSMPFVENSLEHTESEEVDARGDIQFDDGDIDMSGLSETNIIRWVKDISDEARIAVQDEDDGDRDNLMENKPFAAYFINLCHMLPAWSAISCKFFNSPNLVGSSWSSETGFKNTKQLHGDKIPCSPDDFVKRDIEFNNSTVIDASKRYLITVSSDKHTSNDQAKAPESSWIENEERSSGANESEDDGIVPNDVEVGSHAHDQSDEVRDHIDTQTSDAVCAACTVGNMPTAHKCHKCSKFVHLLAGCSVSIGAEEGYGEARECISCYQSAKSQIDHSERAKALNEREIWEKNQRKTRGKYLNPQPNFGLVPVNKKVAITLLMNENITKTVVTIDKVKMKLSNSCAIDSTIQLIAAGIAYHPKYRLYMSRAHEGILEIAKLLVTG